MADVSSNTDPELVALLKEGNQAAYTEIYDRYNGLLYVFAYKRLQDREEAKDLIHELFLKLWADHQIVELNINIAAYLYTALRNRIINLIAHQKVATRYIDSFQFYLDGLGNNNTDHLVRHNEMVAYIETEIANLNPKTQLVFELSRNSNLTRKEIAEKMGISEETVKSHMHTALKTLKAKLGPLFLVLF